MGKRAQGIDWPAIKREYRTGKWTFRELGRKYEIPHTTIMRRAEKDGWEQDLTEAVAHATKAAVIKETVVKAAAGEIAATVDTVLAAAEVNKQVIMRHRQDLVDLRNLAFDMAHELRLATHSPEELAALTQQALQGLDGDTAEAVLQSVKDLLKLHSRIGSMHKLSDTVNKLQTLERKAFSLDDDGAGAGTPPRQFSDLELASRLAYFVDLGRKRAEEAAPEK